MTRAETVNLKEILSEASQALAQVDAQRLEAMALYCETLLVEPVRAATDHCEVTEELAIFERVLEATRANLRAMRRLRELRATHVDGYELAGCGALSEADYGHD